MINIVWNVDCMEHMKGVPDNYFELAIVDPPYGLKWGSVENLLECGDLDLLKKNSKKSLEWDIKPPLIYFNELKRISQKYIVFGYNYFTEFLGNSNNIIVWNKGVTGNKFLSRHEILYASFNASDIININVKQGKNVKIHSCEKPVAIYKWLLQNYAKPGDKILDTHIGSGSIRIACHDMGFDLTGCELDPDYWQAQEDRYQRHIQQGSLFEFEGGEVK